MHEKPVIVLDTNVFISGLLSPNGAPGLILRRFRQRDFKIVTSRSQIAEIQAVLKRPSLAKELPKGTPKEALRFFLAFRKLTEICKPPRLQWNFSDPGDHFLLDIVKHISADFLVTGDRKLQQLKMIDVTSIVSPVEFLASL